MQGIVREVVPAQDLARVELKLGRRSLWVELELWQMERALER
jgi:hypothetical protein